MTYFAAIDIGSNALRLAVAKSFEGQLHMSLRLREAVRLGSDVFAEGRLSDETYTRLKEALLIFKNQLENFNVVNYRAVATSAMREAKNAKKIVQRLKEDTGIFVEIISGGEEAELVFSAISQKIDLHKGTHLIIDIGGGSIELVAIDMGQILKKESFPLGTVRTMALHKKQKAAAMDQWYPAHLQQELAAFFLDLPPLDVAIGTGGNMDRFAKIKGLTQEALAEGLDFQEIVKMSKAVRNYSIAERIENFQIRRDRADVIEPAIYATKTIMEMAGAQKIRLPQVGLKEGLLHQCLETLKKVSSETAPEF